MTPRRTMAASRRVVIVAADACDLIRRRTPLLATLAAAGHKVVCLTAAATADERARLSAMAIETRDFPIERTRIGLLAGRTASAKLVAHFADLAPNVILAFGLRAMLLAARAASRTPDAHVVVVATSLTQFGHRPGIATQWLARRALRNADAIVVHNQDDAARLALWKLLPSGVAPQVLPGAGVDLQRYVPVALPPLDGGFVFAMATRLERSKGVLEFCEAARRVKAKSPSARFVLSVSAGVGPTALRPADLKPYDGIVEVVEAAGDVRALLAACHVFVLPAWGEGLAHEVVEALASGRPAITTNTPGCAVTVDERVSGVLVPPGDAPALAIAMESFLRRPDLMAWMAQASRHKAERCFDATAVNAALLRIMNLEART